MSVLKEEAVQLIQSLSENQIRYVIKYIQILKAGTKEVSTPEMDAFLELENMLVPAMSEIDYDKELAEAREKIYDI